MQEIAAVRSAAGVILLLSAIFLYSEGVDAVDCEYFKSNISKEHNLRKRRALFHQAVQHCQNDAALHYSYAYELERSRKYSEALKQYVIALELEPTMAKAYFNMGDIYKSQKQYLEAIHSYRKGLAVEPNNSRVQKNLAEAVQAAASQGIEVLPLPEKK